MLLHPLFLFSYRQKEARVFAVLIHVLSIFMTLTLAQQKKKKISAAKTWEGALDFAVGKLDS